jgi:hypothetical protein
MKCEYDSGSNDEIKGGIIDGTGVGGGSKPFAII